jgi:DNA-directed RNA polymerase subunit RPC12/RpoP
MAARSEFANQVLDELVEELVLEVCFPLHRALRSRATCLNCGKKSENADSWEIPPVGNDEFERRLAEAMHKRVGKLADEVVSREPGLDVFGTKPRTVAIDNFKCSHCGKKVAANRFAKHLEGCMLGGGRASARIADSTLTQTISPVTNKRPRLDDNRASPQTLFPDAFMRMEEVFPPFMV